jgi:hypothetical protein
MTEIRDSDVGIQFALSAGNTSVQYGKSDLRYFIGPGHTIWL